MLSITDDEGNVSVTSIVDTPAPNPNAQIALNNTDEKVLLKVDENEMDLSGYEDDIVEIEEVDVPKRISIKATDSGFAISQRGVVAETVFPITINTPEKKISVSTASGMRYLAVMPYDAVMQIVRSNIISDLGEDGRIELIEGDEGEVLYKVSGEKNIDLLKFVSLPVEVEVQVSALSGKVLKVEQPIWFSLLNVLLV